MTASTTERVLYRDVEELNQANREAGWDAEYRQLSPGPFSASWAALSTDDATLTFERYEGQIEVRAAQPPGTAALVLPFNSCGLTLNGHETDNDLAFVAGPGAELDAASTASTEAFTLSFPPDTIERAMDSDTLGFGAIRGRVKAFRVDRSRLERLRYQLTAATAEVDPPGSGNAPGSRAASCLVDIARSVVADATLPAERGAGSYTAGRAQTIRLAREYVEENLEQPITVGELAAAAHVGPRTLQRHFVSAAGVPVSNYIAARRLNAVRRKLLHSEPARGRITELALAHGFTHLGRFSTAYRQHFGESPGDTLRRRPAHRR